MGYMLVIERPDREPEKIPVTAKRMRIGRSSGDIPFTHAVTLTGPVRVVDHTRALHPSWTVTPA